MPRGGATRSARTTPAPPDRLPVFDPAAIPGRAYSGYRLRDLEALPDRDVEREPARVLRRAVERPAVFRAVVDLRAVELLRAPEALRAVDPRVLDALRAPDGLRVLEDLRAPDALRAPEALRAPDALREALAREGRRTFAALTTRF